MNQSKKIIFRILLWFSTILILLIGFFAFVNNKNGITELNKSAEKTEKPIVELKGTERIPKTAFWIKNSEKGNWFNVEWIHNHKNNAVISIYDDSGQLIIRNIFFKICPTDALKFIENLKSEIHFYDGENIQLKDKCYLLKKNKPLPKSHKN